MVKVKFEFAAFGVEIELEQLLQLVGLVTLQEYETGTGVLPHIGKVELLKRFVVAGEQIEVDVWEEIELIGVLITQIYYCRIRLVTLLCILYNIVCSRRSEIQNHCVSTLPAIKIPTIST